MGRVLRCMSATSSTFLLASILNGTSVARLGFVRSVLTLYRNHCVSRPNCFFWGARFLAVFNTNFSRVVVHPLFLVPFRAYLVRWNTYEGSRIAGVCADIKNVHIGNSDRDKEWRAGKLTTLCPQTLL